MRVEYKTIVLEKWGSREKPVDILTSGLKVTPTILESRDQNQPNKQKTLPTNKETKKTHIARHENTDLSVLQEMITT